MDAEMRAKFKSLLYNANHQTRIEIQAILDADPAVLPDEKLLAYTQGHSAGIAETERRWLSVCAQVEELYEAELAACREAVVEECAKHRPLRCENFKDDRWTACMCGWNADGQLAPEYWDAHIRALAKPADASQQIPGDKS